MRLPLAGLAAVLLAVAPAGAGPIATSFGELGLEGDPGLQMRLMRGGRPVPGASAPYVTVVEIVALPGGGDAALVELSDGGNACTGRYLWVHGAAAGRVRVTPEFGSCLGLIGGVRTGPEGLSVAFRTADPGLTRRIVSYDGARLREIAVHEHEFGAAAAGPGKEVSRWDGAHPSEILDLAGERLRFLQIMGRADLSELRRRLMVASAAGTHDGAVIAEGCMAHDCGDERGLLAIEIATGRPFAAILSEGHPVRLFGGAPEELPAAMRARLAAAE
ncbi:hypothetical protein LNKW23_25610 [Paralimibaculum aggregatum]|uniref:Uncharacterized protein n=2 Tax=Paralimibaculum aggregatum TaxID=3036245 RepID=A0ABQ6LQH5_9RHOB|nr:hypothetical protein LNKW23_25610 [Limibaculum sp. NKW23]